MPTFDIYRRPATSGDPLTLDVHVATVIGSDDHAGALRCYSQSAGLGGFPGGSSDRWWGNDYNIYRAQRRA